MYASPRAKTNMEATSPSSFRGRGLPNLGSVVITLGVMVMAFLVLEWDIISVSLGARTLRSSSNLNDLNEMCAQTCTARRQERLNHFGGRDLMDRQDVKQQVVDAKNRLLSKLERDYGKENLRKMFWETDGTLRPYVPISDESAGRLKRKLLIKILTAQTALQRQEKNFNGCDCTHNASIVYQMQRETLSTNDATTSFETPTFAKYVWATGGHSAAAGHGNLFNESYTAVLERDLQGVFESIGIAFEGRNYAMGGTGSAAEISLCWTEIFGDDIDFFTYDYGMTDAGEPLRILHYGYRGGISKGRPALLVVRILNGDQGLGMESLKALEDSIGMPVFTEDGTRFTAMRDEIPDSAGLSTAELNTLPDLIRNFKCNGIVEKGDPYCGDEKYSDLLCQDREGKAPWHPGWKRHAMVGHAIALFLLDAIVDAVESLVEMESMPPEELLSQLKLHEDTLYQNASGTKGIQDLSLKFLPLDSNDEISSHLSDPSVFFDGKSICHTARLPSQTRYLGYLTGTKKIGGPAIFGEETYNTGVPLSVAGAHNHSFNNEIQLVWDDADKWRQSCETVVNPDYKDFFFATEGHGSRQLTFPNQAEQTAYDFDPNSVKGHILLVFKGCDWGQCESGFLGPDDIGGESSKWEMKINDEQVSSLVAIGHGAHIATNKQGVTFPPSESGDYKIEFLVNEASSFVKVSSFIVF